jgi:hypothetical protein
MNQQMDEFLSVGMQRYKQGTAVMISFEEGIETRLQKILSERTPDEWGSFVSTAKTKVKSTKGWKEFPHLKARIDGKLGDEKVNITIAVNWWESESHYPFYEIFLDPKGLWQNPMKEFEWGRKVCEFSAYNKGIRLDPDEDDFNLERDFGILLDELVRFFEEVVGGSDKVTGVGE